jgi:formylglycine-generating enzyme required for sulfatase activity
MKKVLIFLVIWALVNGELLLAADKSLINSIGMEFVRIEAGSFMMGTNKVADTDRGDIVEYFGEKPAHKVTISQPFYIGKYEVTQEQWEAIMGSNPSQVKGPQNPVENVTWLESQQFIKLLNEKERTNKYRLPTEAEWEYAARAGSNSDYYFGDAPEELERYGWYDKNSPEDTSHPVGLKEPNKFGVYDIHGNVSEWVNDWYQKDYYLNSPAEDPKGPPSGTERLFRGGNYRNPYYYCWVFGRGFEEEPNSKNKVIGFRIAFSDAK